MEKLELIAEGEDGKKITDEITFQVIASNEEPISFNIDVSMDKRSYKIGDEALVRMKFSEEVTAKLIEYLPDGTTKTIFHHRRFSAGTHTLQGEIEAPTEQKILELTASGRRGKRAKDTVSFQVSESRPSRSKDSKVSVIRPGLNPAWS